VPVARTAFEALVGDELRAALATVGLLVEDGDALHGAARLVPHDELLIASDHAGGTEEHADHVPGVHRPSVALAHLTVRGSGERALDVGTGNGIQAILLAAHAERVVATDVNPRALAYASFNAAANGVANVETRLGSFLEPAAGETFELVVANPPYVVSPEHALLFRDGDLPGDGVSEHVVRAVPPVLAAGAFASVLIAWALDPADPFARPRAWLDGAGCDALLLHTSTDDPVETAATWNRDLLDRPEAYADALDRWLAYYRELGIERLGYACLVLRKRADGRDGRFRALQLPHAALRPAGAHVRRLFATDDRLEHVDDEALLARRLRVVDDAVVAQESSFGDGAWHGLPPTLRLGRGLPFSAGLDAATARTVRLLDGTRTLAEALAEGAADESPGAGAVVARGMLEVGFLELCD
jgi:SAM-dependent methyltransferase